MRNGASLSPDDVIDRSERSQRSAYVKSAVTVRLAQQESRVLDHTLAQFRGGLLTAEQARDAIAQISALRDFAYALDKEISVGAGARAQLDSPGPGVQGQRGG